MTVMKTRSLCKISNLLFHAALHGSILNASLSYDRASHTLTCVSSGGPVNAVTWRRNGADISSSFYQLQQSLVDARTSTYHSLLTVTSSNVRERIGSFSCLVSNSRGRKLSQTVDVDGIVFS
jgi:hypothetical protein